jgi:peptide-methionine (S)-S-oxide reductase
MAESKLETAILGGGCFWCTQAIFERVRGVESVEAGYSGGALPNPSYELVASGVTGHAEVIRIKFDPAAVTYKDLLIIFFHLHDPTTLNRQGADLGSEYRSAIFFTSQEQERTAQETKAEIEASKLWSKPLVTEIKPAGEFYLAEDYHQDYFKKNTSQPYCSIIIAPKIAKLEREFKDKLKPKESDG